MNIQEASLFERRYVVVDEIRADFEKRKISGYAALFNVWSEDLGGFKERIQPGAFAKTIVDGDVRALFNHDPNMILGRTKNNTLRLSEDNKGLEFDADLPDTSYARDLAVSIERKDITQNSFGFQTVRDEWTDDWRKRELIEVKLFDVSPVTFPAYKQTNVKLRLHELGIDYDALSTALLRGQRGAVIDTDVELIRSTIAILENHIPDNVAPLTEEDGTEHPEESAPLTEADDHEHPTPELAPDLVSTLMRARIAEMAIRKHLKRRVF